MTTRHDLDAARAARQEAGAKPHVVILGGEQFELVAELPIVFAEMLAGAHFREAVSMLLADPTEAERFIAKGISVPDLAELAKLYGMAELGKSPASPRSSASAGT